MATYVYLAVTPSGEERKGELEASSAEVVVRQLQQTGLIAVQVDLARAGIGIKGLRSSRNRLQRVQQFSQELAELMRAGISLDRALQIMHQASGDEAQRAVLKRIQDSVQRGQSLSVALRQQDGLFSPFYISMIQAAESGGSLAEGLSDAAAYLERNRELREQLTSALIYPAILFVVALFSLTIIMVYVIPQFEQLFADMGEALPLSTRVVVTSAEWVRELGPWVLLILVLLWLVLRRQLKKPEIRLKWDATLLRGPVLGDLLQGVETARFCRSLGTLLKGGVALVPALQLAKGTLTNAVFVALIEEVTADVRAGRRLADQLQASGRFPVMAMQMIQVGEETGQLDQALLKVAERYDRQVSTLLQRLLTLLEPILIVGLGVLIAGIIMSILVAIMSINQLPL